MPAKHWMLMVAVAGGWTSSATAWQDATHWFPEANGVARAYLGAKQCADCHDRLPESAPARSAPYSHDFLSFLLSLDSGKWALMSELLVWGEFDKHFQASAVLANARSQRMGEILNIKDVQRDVRCLACHCGVPVDQLEPALADTSPGAEERLKRLDVNNGVACEGCHGPSGDRPEQNLTGWLDTHTRRGNPNFVWRFVSAAEKRNKFGYVDVRSPIAQTQMCLSCHLGDVAMGRVVTHEMYAAGHPPLPGFEAQTFGTQMPNHWRRLEEKPAAMRQEYLAKSPGVEDPGPLPRTRQVLIGAVVQRRQALQLCADLAGQTTPMRGGIEPPAWPDLALFECSACHHDLRRDGWRQQRRPLGAPGRPLLNDHSEPLLTVALAVLGRNEVELEKQMAPVRAALTKRAFGDPDELRAACRQGIVWCDAVAQELVSRSWKAEEARIVLVAIFRRGSQSTDEYDATRQLVWAFDAALAESDYKANLEVEKVAAELRSHFLLTLHSGRVPLGQSGEQLSAAVHAERLPVKTQREPVQFRLVGERREILELDLSRVLPFIANHDPRKTQAAFSELLKLMDGPGAAKTPTPANR